MNITNQQLRMEKKSKPTEFKCQVCSKKYATRTSLSRHLLSHNSDEESRKPFKCNLCPSRFTTKQHLDYHMNRHSDTRAFWCEVCNRGFNTKHAYMLHLKGEEKCDGKGVRQRKKMKFKQASHDEENQTDSSSVDTSSGDSRAESSHRYQLPGDSAKTKSSSSVAPQAESFYRYELQAGDYAKIKPNSSVAPQTSLYRYELQAGDYAKIKPILEWPEMSPVLEEFIPAVEDPGPGNYHVHLLKPNVDIVAVKVNFDGKETWIKDADDIATREPKEILALEFLIQ